MSFHGLIIHFFLLLYIIPLFGCTTVYLPIHLLKDILVASKWGSSYYWIPLGLQEFVNCSSDLPTLALVSTEVSAFDFVL